MLARFHFKRDLSFAFFNYFLRILPSISGASLAAISGFIPCPNLLGGKGLVVDFGTVKNGDLRGG